MSMMVDITEWFCYNVLFCAATHTFWRLYESDGAGCAVRETGGPASGGAAVGGYPAASAQGYQPILREGPQSARMAWDLFHLSAEFLEVG